MAETPPNQSQTPKKLSWLRNFALDNALKIVGGLILTALGLLWYNARNYTETVINERVESYVSEMISKNVEKNEALKKKILEIVKQDRKFEAGATIAGSFTLTPSNRSNTVYIFCPPNHTPKLYYDLSEFTKTRYVQAQATNLPLRTLKQEDSIPLHTCPSGNDNSSATPSEDDAEEQASERNKIDEIIAITFQLAGPDVTRAVTTGQNPDNISIDVRYAAFVSPAITIGK